MSDLTGEICENSFIIEGRNAVLEALKSGKSIDKLHVLGSPGEKGGSMSSIIARCREDGAVIIYCDRKKLDQMSETGAHQGVIASVSGCVYKSITDMLKASEDSGRPPLIVICDHIEDPHNLGAVIRNAEVAGAHGVVIPKRRGAGITPTALKASAGAALHLPIARSSNIVNAIKELKQAGLWVYGADANGDKRLYDADFKGPCAVVLGSEGSGMSRLVRENCDFLVGIPMLGKLNSLNVSAAAAVVLFETVRQRTF